MTDSQSVWLRETAPLPSDAAPTEATVAVIGGGVAGITTALHLARAGVDVLVLEAGDVAARASGRNDGQLLLGLGEHYNRIHGQFGPDRARLLWDFLQRNHDEMLAELRDAGIECSLEQAGGLRLAETVHEQEELRKAAALLRADGRRHELLEAADVAARLPRSRGYHGGLFLEEEAIVQPAAMVRGLAARAVEAGATIAQRCAARAIRGEAGDFTVELEDGRGVQAQVVVHCTAALGQSLDRTGLLGRAVFAYRGQIVATDPLPDEIAAQFPACAMSSNFCYEYFRMHRRRFVLGGMRWSVPGEEVGVVDDANHHPQVSENLIAYARRHFPDLADVPFPHVWTGVMAGSPDALPLCGAMPGQPGEFALLGFNGYGLSFAFLAGKCLSELIIDGESRHEALPMFAPRRLLDRDA
ncbi:MAG: FAD-dependent oxidoreductase [Planctomycetota bacterium]|nr:FAD-dependent oxidoreductase [Planctomycetota bacterium]